MGGFGLKSLCTVAAIIHQVLAGMDLGAASELELSNTTMVDTRSTTLSRDILQAQDDYTCTSKRPCKNGACCGQSNVCGYGPVYCGTGCQSNCGAYAECGQFALKSGGTCPLNVCCSEFGFCGTTREFCGVRCQSNCGGPTSGSRKGSDLRKRVIGYYEGWSATKTTCAKMTPDQIPVTGLTHVNFAFAYIEPRTWNIIPMVDYPGQLFGQVTNMKSRQPGLKVWVSIGGWAFNDNDTTTQSIFSDISRSSANRDAFSLQLVRFMFQYGFDGADIDWEYPGAPDRGGSFADIANYVELLKAIKRRYATAWKEFGLSFTAPTSYWYLRWFDLQGLAYYVNWINLMTYDLHGIWDSDDPIGPYVYAHTNLTEIDEALDLFWRSKVPANMINLGLAFYGRSFHLKNPKCVSPGCQFEGPGAKGKCSDFAGILSWKDVNSMLSSQGITGTYDADAAVNYATYRSGSGLAWVSYDNTATFQQKIDYANSKGLAGLFIWAVDQDDDSLTALKAVTGKDLVPQIAQSDTLGTFNLDLCYITPCGADTSCKAGFDTMVHLNTDRNGQGCSGKNHQQRTFCCPAWGAPDPKQCTWRGSSSQCYGQCLPGEVNMVQDNYGSGGHCDHGIKTWCCPATNAQSAIAACKDTGKKTCPANLPQKISTIGRKKNVFCCPAEPVFNHCQWYGAKTSCDGNHCPVGQVELATSVEGDGSDWQSCVLKRQHALCCDAPLSGTPFLPVPLKNLFPDTTSWSPAYSPKYYEAFDTSKGQFPNPTLVANDPNEQSFAWLIVVGASSDVQSLRKRDNQHVEVFDCPSPHAKDLGVQSLKVLCTHPDHPDSSCEGLYEGGVLGTVVHLPDDCGPDKLIRAIDFKEITDYELPHHLVKRATYRSKVYELRYDYNFKQLRRDGGPVHIRIDVSNHPGYWNEIVSSAPGSPVRKRTTNNWREHDKRWFSETRMADWVARFDKLKKTRSFGISKDYHFTQTLYSASKFCPPSATADMSIVIKGNFKFRLDFGFTLIGELRSFDFSESYAYFSHNDLVAQVSATMYGNAAFKMQSEVLPLLTQFPIFGVGYNIKGILVVGPYFSVDAQIQAQATLSGEVGMQVIMTAPTGFDYVFPPSTDTIPTAGKVYVDTSPPSVQAGTSASINAAGSIMISIIPTIGFNLEISALSKELTHTDIRTSFRNDLIVRIDAGTASSCSGIKLGVAWGQKTTLQIKTPIKAWRGNTWTISDSVRDVVTGKCYPWGKKPWRREYLGDQPQSLSVKRDGGENTRASTALNADPEGSCLLCPNAPKSETGDCFVKSTFEDVIDMDNGLTKRDLWEYATNLTSSKRDLEKRETRTLRFCNKDSVMTLTSPEYDPSGDFIDHNTAYHAYGPTTPSDCNDYGFGDVGPPPSSSSEDWATEHILELQTVQIFLTTLTNKAMFPGLNNFKNPEGYQARKTKWSRDQPLSFCKYMSFWWYFRNAVMSDGTRTTPLNMIMRSFPSKTNGHVSEFMLLQKEVNGMKALLWAEGRIRTPKKFTAKIKKDVNGAINDMKNVYFAYLYMCDPLVQAALIAPATRIAEAFDNMEHTVIPNKIAEPGGYSSEPYENMHLNVLWKSFIKARFNYAMDRAITFMDAKVAELKLAHADPAIKPVVGEPELNPAVLNRVTKLAAAWATRPSYTNPFPANW